MYIPGTYWVHLDQYPPGTYPVPGTYKVNFDVEVRHLVLKDNTLSCIPHTYKDTHVMYWTYLLHNG